MTTTIITAFFDIDRETKGDGRKLTEYFEWIKKTLQLNCNLYIVTEKKFVDFIKAHRPLGYSTFIKEDVLSNASYYKYLTKMRNIMESNEYKQKIKHPNRVECILPEYNIIQYSKFGWLEEAINTNIFNSEYFFWMDAGISRFFYGMNLENKYPSKTVSLPDNKFIAQGRRDIYGYIFDENFIWKSDNLVYGGMFGGHYTILLEISKKVMDIFETELLKNNCVNNEQLVLGLLWKIEPTLFNLISPYNTPCDVLHYLYSG